MTSGVSKKAVTVAVDAMGGDYAPQEIVKGAIEGARKEGIEIILVGQENAIRKEVMRYDISGLSIHVRNASEVIQEGESPVAALRRKPDASIAVATQLVKTHEADAVMSMGNTGAVMVSAIKILGKLKGIKSPSAGGLLSGFAPNTVVFDLGPTTDCKPHDLLSLAVMGCIVARKILGISNPTVALLSNGSEEGKGNLLVNKAYQIFKESNLNFIGNVEGNDIPAGKANVVVCDGFMGNILIKFCEGLGDSIIERLKVTFGKHLPNVDFDAVSNDLFALTHVAENGGPICGVDGVVIVGHGRSKAPQVADAIHIAKTVVTSNLVEELKTELGNLQ
ncbi:MAG: phosphate acyltransferase PlsX [Dehalococcoidia bacterium]|nr:phosphate acyltransferase PlsX [Dehalococcoidia bacterium]